MNYTKVLIPIDGKKIARARKKAGISQNELAALTGIFQAYISYIENCKVRSIHKRTYDKINKIIQI